MLDAYQKRGIATALLQRMAREAWGNGIRTFTASVMWENRKLLDGLRTFGADIKPGDFAENLTTVGIDLSNVAVGDRFQIGDEIKLVVTQIGKTCHNGCYIREQVGDCIMPRVGLFARVERGGQIRTGDSISLEQTSV